MRVLYRLQRDAEQDQDFFSSTTAASCYEAYLLAVVSFFFFGCTIWFLRSSEIEYIISRRLCLQAETLKDSFPASDRSLIRLLGEAPYLSNGVIKLLESLCSPGSVETGSKETHNGDRVTQGLSAVWSLITLRPPFRIACLKIALQVCCFLHRYQFLSFLTVFLMMFFYVLTCLVLGTIWNRVPFIILKKSGWKRFVW